MRTFTLGLAAAAALAAPAAAQEPTQQRGITTSGDAAVTAPNDIARFSLGATALRNTPSAAQRAASRRMRRVVAAVRAHGVAAADITTQGISLRRVTRRLRRSNRIVLVGYRATQAVRVTSRNLSKVGAIIDAAIRAGATAVSSLSFDVSSREGLYEQALRLAYRRARAKAEHLAQEAGVTLGRAIRISERGAEVFAETFGQSEAAAGRPSAPTQVLPGRSRIEAGVVVTFETST